MLNINEIKEIIQLIDKSTIDEFTYESTGTTISLKKNNLNGIIEKPVIQAPVQTEETQQTPVQEQVKTDNIQTSKADEHENANEIQFDYEIKSPMVGTFYSKPSPESDVFVENGSKVTPNTVVCIVEAMKLFNEIEAEVSGEIVEVLVQDGELVEYGQTLFRVKK